MPLKAYLGTMPVAPESAAGRPRAKGAVEEGAGVCLSGRKAHPRVLAGLG